MCTNNWIPTSQRPIIASKFYQKATAARLLAQPSIDPRTKTGFWKKHGATAASCQLHIGLKQLSSNGHVCSIHLHWCLADTFAPHAPTPRTLPFLSLNTTETGNSQLSACPPLNLHYLVLTISCHFQKLIFQESQFVQLADSWETSFYAHRLLKLQLYSKQLLGTSLFMFDFVNLGLGSGVTIESVSGRSGKLMVLLMIINSAGGNPW